MERLVAMDDQVGQELEVGLVQPVPLDDRARPESGVLQASPAHEDQTDSLDSVLLLWRRSSTSFRKLRKM